MVETRPNPREGKHTAAAAAVKFVHRCTALRDNKITRQLHVTALNCITTRNTGFKYISDIAYFYNEFRLKYLKPPPPCIYIIRLINH